jgi:hypothetical protein
MRQSTIQVFSPNAGYPGKRRGLTAWNSSQRGDVVAAQLGFHLDDHGSLVPAVKDRLAFGNPVCEGRHKAWRERSASLGELSGHDQYDSDIS